MRTADSPLFFGEWLKRRRQSLDLTQAELADSAGNTTVSAWTMPSAPPQEEVIYLGLGRHGRINQLPFADEDILAYRPATGAWSLAFDGSTVGLTFTDVKGFYPLPDGQLLLTFGHITFLSGLGWMARMSGCPNWARGSTP